MERKYTEKLARLLLICLYVAIAFAALYYFGAVIGYILISFVIALIAKPVMGLLRKPKIKGKSLPDSILAVIVIALIVLVLNGVGAGLAPVVKRAVLDIVSASSDAGIEGLSSSLAGFNALLGDAFHLAPDFKIETLLLDKLSSILSLNIFGNVIGSVASTFVGVAIGTFSVVFIAYFLIKDENIVSRFVSVFTPDRHTDHMAKTLKGVENLLSRYFLGLLVEMFCVGVLDFLGLWLVAGLDLESATGIAFMACLLNIIPYLGPLLGGCLGAVMGIVVKFCSPYPLGLDVGFWAFAAILVAIFLVVKLVDDFVLQPLIYSTSVKAHPLEIFLVLLLAGTMGGVVGMLVAIPAYTALRVFLINFYPDSKLAKALSPARTLVGGPRVFENNG